MWKPRRICGREELRLHCQCTRLNLASEYTKRTCAAGFNQHPSFGARRTVVCVADSCGGMGCGLLRAHTPTHSPGPGRPTDPIRGNKQAPVTARVVPRPSPRSAMRSCQIRARVVAGSEEQVAQPRAKRPGGAGRVGSRHIPTLCRDAPSGAGLGGAALDRDAAAQWSTAAKAEKMGIEVKENITNPEQ